MRAFTIHSFAGSIAIIIYARLVLRYTKANRWPIAGHPIGLISAFMIAWTDSIADAVAAAIASLAPLGNL